MATRTTYSASVTHEFDLQPCRTWRGEIQAANGAQAARRAYALAQKAFPGSRPRSVVVVLEVGERVALPKVPRPVVAEVEGVPV